MEIKINVLMTFPMNIACSTQTMKRVSCAPQTVHKMTITAGEVTDLILCPSMLT